MAGSRTTRARAKRTGVRRRAVGTRDRIITHLATVAEVADARGMASTRLAEAVGYPGSSVAFAQLLSGMERDGLIAREVRGKRTYRITLSGGTAAAGRPGARPARRDPGAPAAAEAPVAEAGGLAGSRSVAGAAPAGLDYDELARRLLIQVVRRLASTPSDLEQTVAGLERELATAWTRHATLTAENVRLREQLTQTQHDLDLARRRNRQTGVSDELNPAEVLVLGQLLAPEQGGDTDRPPRPRAGGDF